MGDYRNQYHKQKFHQRSKQDRMDRSDMSGMSKGEYFETLDPSRVRKPTQEDNEYRSIVENTINNSFESVKSLTEKIFTISITGLLAWIYMADRIHDQNYKLIISFIIYMTILFSFLGLYPFSYTVSYNMVSERKEAIDRVLRNKQLLLIVSSVLFLVSTALIFININLPKIFGGNQ